MTTRVTSKLSYRMNIGNYESFEIVVGVEADALAGETVDEAERRIFSFVEKRLQERAADAYNELVHKGNR